MKRLIEKRNFLVLVIAAALFIFFFDSSLISSKADPETDSLPDKNGSASFSSSPSHEKVIYTCRLEDEEIPAVQISVTPNEDGQVTDTIGRAAVGNGIEVTAPGIAPIWGYKSLAARSGDAVIEVVFEPDDRRKGYDWILTLADGDIFFRSRVRDCMEVSDE